MQGARFTSIWTELFFESWVVISKMAEQRMVPAMPKQEVAMKTDLVETHRIELIL
jgi:hypothetical protein